MPEGHPRTVLRAKISCRGVMARGSVPAPTMTNFPSGPSPSTSADIAFESGAVARITAGAAQLLQRCGGWTGIGINVVMSAQFLGQWLLVCSTADRDRAETHLACELNAQVTQAADALHRNQVARPSPRHDASIENCNPGAQQRRGFIRRQVIGYRPRPLRRGSPHTLRSRRRS